LLLRLINTFNYVINSNIIIALLTGFIMAFILAYILALVLIPVLHILKFGQYIRDDGPKSHLKKANTPTIGGLIFIFGTTISTIIMFTFGKVNNDTRIVLLAFICFGLVGFLDDILKIIHKNNLGLRALEKIVLLLIVSVPLSYYTYIKMGSSIHISFTDKYANLGWSYIPLAIIYLIGMTNAVNLTDGIDGLATTITILVAILLSIVSYRIGNLSLSIFCVILSGSLLAFLKFNAFPAKIFMGDTGSLALGGAIATVALFLKMPLLLFIIGGIYIIETLSVILQVASFKIRKKRIFKMAPIHHHFELCKWNEIKIVSIFSIITVIFCFIGLLSI